MNNIRFQGSDLAKCLCVRVVCVWVEECEKENET